MSSRSEDIPNSDIIQKFRDPLPKKERVILNVFREYRMTPGKMLCLSQLDSEVYGSSLASLVARKLLVAERYQHGYSLTENGYRTMRACPIEAS